MTPEEYWKARAARFRSLADKCDQGSGEDPALEQEIALTLSSPPRGPIVGDPYTRSLDAAVSLYVNAPEQIPSSPRKAAAEGLRQRAEQAMERTLQEAS
jgi:hypothetical protein